MSTEKMSRRRFLQISAATSASLVASVSLPALKPSAAAAEALRQEKVPVTFMVPGSQQEDADFAPVFEAFAAAHPEIDGQYTPAGTGYNAQYNDKLLTLFAAGIAPDVFKSLFGNFGAYGALGVLTPLDDFVAKYPDITQLDDFFTNHVEGSKINGQLMALPNDGAPEAIWYNVNMFDAAGQAYPDWDWTWDKLTEVAQTLTKEENGIYTQHGVGTPNWLDVVWSNGGEVLNADGTKCMLDQPEAVEALKWMQSLFTEYKVTPSPEAIADVAITDRFSTGKLGMFYGTRGSLGALRAITDFKFDAAPMVMSNKETRITQLYIGWTSVYSGSQHPDEAYKLAAFVASPEGQRLRISRGYAHPSRRSLVEQDWFKNYTCDSCNSTNVNNIFPEMLLREEARAWPAHPREAEILQVINTELEYLRAGAKPAEQVAADMTSQIDAILAS